MSKSRLEIVRPPLKLRDLVCGFIEYANTKYSQITFPPLDHHLWHDWLKGLKIALEEYAKREKKAKRPYKMPIQIAPFEDNGAHAHSHELSELMAGLVKTYDFRASDQRVIFTPNNKLPRNHLALDYKSIAELGYQLAQGLPGFFED